MTPRPPAHRWEFRARFRRGSFGWRSQPAIQRVKEAVSEITVVARKDPILGAEGAVLFIERVSPALENVASSSGAIGSAVNGAIATLVPIISEAPADPATRAKWLERIHTAHGVDEIPSIETLAEYWGDLCASKEVAAAWAERLLWVTQQALSQDRSIRGFYHGTPACLIALHRAERYAEILDLVSQEKLWHYRQWGVRALAAMGRTDDAIRFAESSRNPWASDGAIDRLCEEILLAAGRSEGAFARYAATANRAGTYLATFRAVVRKYPHTSKAEILLHLVDSTPGQEGKWFAAAKAAGLRREALALAQRSPCDPRTLDRAARDHIEDDPAFALECGLLALDGMLQGYAYDLAGSEAWACYSHTLNAARRLGREAEIEATLRARIASDTGFAAQALRAVLRMEGS